MNILSLLIDFLIHRTLWLTNGQRPELKIVHLLPVINDMLYFIFMGLVDQRGARRKRINTD